MQKLTQVIKIACKVSFAQTSNTIMKSLGWTLTLCIIRGEKAALWTRKQWKALVLASTIAHYGTRNFKEMILTYIHNNRIEKIMLELLRIKVIKQFLN